MFTHNFNKEQRNLMREAREEGNHSARKAIFNKKIKDVLALLIVILVIVFFRSSYENWVGNSYLLTSGFIIGIAFIFRIFGD